MGGEAADADTRNVERAALFHWARRSLLFVILSFVVASTVSPPRRVHLSGAATAERPLRRRPRACETTASANRATGAATDAARISD
mmetsp:Transcript_12460/g.57708  ORF Transcript_12460/g.57708 Transcript_12460/m.57708 type:complete len:86 (+) Transcript_12460:1527-1784(+)